ncbi:hypothetical protein CXIVA_02680 [Clostridium sp. SY8519]|jgi:DegV family protein with EDD domain|nr:hypothetical protein CXIVA_02680 [Clostridium sp. SY8519]
MLVSFVYACRQGYTEGIDAKLLRTLTKETGGFLSKIAILTDSNSGITQAEAGRLGVTVMPMPFFINGELFLEDITLTQEQFYERLTEGADIHTSAPSPADFTDTWDKLLETHDEVICIPMSSGLSSTCSTATMLAQDYDGKVFVVDNQRISVTQRQSVLDALMLAKAGKSGQEIYDALMENKMESSIYIMLDTLQYLKKGGRITPAAAALGTLLRLKPVLQIQGEKLDAFAKARTVKQAKSIMIRQIQDDCRDRFGSADGTGIHISMSYTHDLDAALKFKEEVQQVFPNHEIVMQPLSLSISCHIGPGSLAVTATKAIPLDSRTQKKLDKADKKETEEKEKAAKRVERAEKRVEKAAENMKKAEEEMKAAREAAGQK